MKKIVMCLAMMMAIGVVAVGCTREKKEEVQPGSMLDKAQQPAVDVVTEKAPMPVEGAKEQVGGAVTDMGQMGHGAVPETAPLGAEPVAGAVGQAVEPGQGVVQEGTGAMPGEAGAIKQETDQAVEALPEGAGGVVGGAEAPSK